MITSLHGKASNPTVAHALGALLCAVFALATYYLVPIGGDAYSEFDSLYYLVSHLFEHGETPYWNPYHYGGQQVEPGSILLFGTSADHLVAQLMQLIGVEIPYASLHAVYDPVSPA